MAGVCLLVVLGLRVEDQLRRCHDAALRKYGRAGLVTLNESVPHGDQASRANDKGRTIVGITLLQLAKQFGADKRLPQAHHVRDVATAVVAYHVQPSPDCVQLEVGQVLLASRFQGQGISAV